MPEFIGTNGKDTLIGTEEADYINGQGGNDSIEGGGGNDTLIGGDGWNTVRGGWGDDLVVGAEFNDFLSGSSGDDTIIGLGGDDYGSGRTGDDVYFLGDGNDTFSGHEGADTAFGGAGDDWLYMSDWWEPYEAGLNLVGGGTGNDLLWGGAAVDWFYYNANRAGEGNDVIDHFNRGNQGESDKIVFFIDDILAASPGIAGLRGDPNELTLADLDAHPDWFIRSDGGDVEIVFPNGTIRIDDLRFTNARNSFQELAQYIELSDVNLEWDVADFMPGPGPGPDPDPEPDPEPEPDPLPAPEPGDNVIDGNDWNEWLKGTTDNDWMAGRGGDDNIRGNVGNDKMFGGNGNDTLRGEVGDDQYTGGDGADVFSIRAGRWAEGNDVITDFERGTDTISLDGATLAQRQANLAGESGDANTVELNDMDAAAGWSVSASANGYVLVTHPTGSFEIEGLLFDATTDSFTKLADILTIDGNAIPVGTAPDPDPEPDPDPNPDPDPDPNPDPNTITGNPWNEWLKGTNNAETLDGLAGNDVVRGYAGDDTLIGGEGDDTLRGEAGSDEMSGNDGADVFRIRSGKWDQGDDVITDFEVGTDTVLLVAADMLNANPGLAGGDGVLGLDDLDADGAFTLSESANGNLLIGHQTGSVELNGVAFGNNTDSFVEIANILDIEVA